VAENGNAPIGSAFAKSSFVGGGISEIASCSVPVP
jgi:hypothetical protein